MVLAQGAALPAGSQDRPLQSRDALGEAIREVLVETPSLLAPLRTPEGSVAADLYSEDAARDLDVLGRAVPRLFARDLPGFGPEGAPAAIAFFTQEGCAECANAEAELRDLATRLGVRVSRFDITEDAAFAAELGLDMAPSYVLPDMLLRGAMPAIVLEKYLTR
jgi:hypothetical protein